MPIRFYLVLSVSLLALLIGCDGTLSDSVSDPTSPAPEVVYSEIIPPGGEDPGDWSLEQWELIWPTLPFQILHARIMWAPESLVSGKPSFGLFTELTTPLSPVVMPKVSQLYVAQINADGSFTAAAGGDQYFHSQPDGIRLENFDLPGPDCSEISNYGTWLINSSHRGRWDLIAGSFSFLFQETKGPENDEKSGECELWGESPPIGGGGGDGGTNCVTYLVTISIWNGDYWEVVDQFLMDVCD